MKTNIVENHQAKSSFQEMMNDVTVVSSATSLPKTLQQAVIFATLSYMEQSHFEANTMKNRSIGMEIFDPISTHDSSL